MSTNFDLTAVHQSGVMLARPQQRNVIFALIASAVLLQFVPLGWGQDHHRSLEIRSLSKMTDHLHAYQNEAPIGAGRGTTMLLGIFSMKSDKAKRRRQLIRSSLLSSDYRICSLGEFQRQASDTPNQRSCQIPYTFVIGAGDNDRPTDHNDEEPVTLDSDQDGETEDDCTYLNIRENMEHGKSPTFLKYVSSIAKTNGLDFVAKIDDDTVMAMPLLLEFINDDLPPAPYNRRIYGGSFVPSRKRQHIYAQGQFYFMSVDLAEYIGSSMSAAEREKHSVFIEDLDIGTFVQSIQRPIKIIDITSRTFWLHPRKKDHEFLDSIENQIETLPHYRPTALNFGFYCPHWSRNEFQRSL